jgi:hypothetical protein
MKTVAVEGFWCDGGCGYLCEGTTTRCTLFNQSLQYESYEDGDVTYHCPECLTLFTPDKLV